MGEKVTFNEITKVIEIDEAPDVNGDVLINVKSDLYSDGKEDWVANENLRKFYFPIEAEGGRPLPGEKDLGSSFFLASDWKIQPYDANHRLIIDGNLYSVDGSDPFIDTVSNYPVRIMQQVSDLVSTITVASGSGLSTEEHDQLMALPDSVWNSKLAEFTIAGTFGAELATKADISASASTSYNIAISGSVIEGSEDSGTFASVQIRDDNYWQIGEVVGDGLTIELVFNIPDGHKPGQLEVFGRYIGVPSTTHFLNCLAYNYEAAAWEILVSNFMPGGMNSDIQYSHEYYERNIDRTNNNEVKIRLVHNVTTYNASHALYLDLVSLSSIEVVTASDIADAVWQHSDGSDLLLNVVRILGLTQENYYMDQTSYTDYNGAKLLDSARIRIYSVAGSVGTANDVIATYTITAVWSAGSVETYKVVKQ